MRSDVNSHWVLSVISRLQQRDQKSHRQAWKWTSFGHITHWWPLVSSTLQNRVINATPLQEHLRPMRGTQASPQSNMKQDEGAAPAKAGNPVPTTSITWGPPFRESGMPQQTISQLVGSTRRRCQPVIDAQGLVAGSCDADIFLLCYTTTVGFCLSWGNHYCHLLPNYPTFTI